MKRSTKNYDSAQTRTQERLHLKCCTTSNKGFQMINKFRFDSTVNLKRHQVILRLTVIIIAFGIVGHADYEDAERQHGEYCEMIKLS